MVQSDRNATRISQTALIDECTWQGLRNHWLGAGAHNDIARVEELQHPFVDSSWLWSLTPHQGPVLDEEEFPEAVFHKWPIPQGTENTDALDILKVDSQAEETVFKGKSFILTGRLHDLKQGTVKQAIKERGGTVLNQEKRGVKYYLILGTGAGASESKSHTNALTNTNAKIITTDQFLDLVKKGKKNQKKNQK